MTRRTGHAAKMHRRRRLQRMRAAVDFRRLRSGDSGAVVTRQATAAERERFGIGGTP